MLKRIRNYNITYCFSLLYTVQCCVTYIKSDIQWRAREFKMEENVVNNNHDL